MIIPLNFGDDGDTFLAYRFAALGAGDVTVRLIAPALGAADVVASVGQNAALGAGDVKSGDGVVVFVDVISPELDRARG